MGFYNLQVYLLPVTGIPRRLSTSSSIQPVLSLLLHIRCSGQPGETKGRSARWLAGHDVSRHELRAPCCATDAMQVCAQDISDTGHVPCEEGGLQVCLQHWRGCHCGLAQAWLSSLPASVWHVVTAQSSLPAESVSREAGSTQAVSSGELRFIKARLAMVPKLSHFFHLFSTEVALRQKNT